MANMNTEISWADVTWSPITGCSRVSKGCEKCYAERLAGGRLKHHPAYKGLTRPTRHGPVWTGEVRFNDEALTLPLRWRKPRRVFVNSMSDLFHDAVTDEQLDQMFAVMSIKAHSQWLCLTKRPERMRDYMLSRSKSIEYWEKQARELGYAFRMDGVSFLPFPPPSIWLGVSVEDQERADERIPLLLETPAAIRFLSVEPLLSPVDLSRWVFNRRQAIMRVVNGPAALNYEQADAYIGHPVDLCIVGGESGPRARDMDPDWARSIRDQCQASGVAFFMKQMARKAPIPDDLMIREMPINERKV